MIFNPVNQLEIGGIFGLASNASSDNQYGNLVSYGSNSFNIDLDNGPGTYFIFIVQNRSGSGIFELEINGTKINNRLLARNNDYGYFYIELSSEKNNNNYDVYYDNSLFSSNVTKLTITYGVTTYFVSCVFVPK